MKKKEEEGVDYITGSQSDMNNTAIMISNQLQERCRSSVPSGRRCCCGTGRQRNDESRRGEV
jgi:hypothetical protein